VAGDAGVSVPNIANLENGRGNSTVAALDRLATALGARLEVALVPAAGRAAPAAMPPSLVRLGRSPRPQFPGYLDLEGLTPVLDRLWPAVTRRVGLFPGAEYPMT
jgi:transcriptional regulator with XRE-family HTH domain